METHIKAARRVLAYLKDTINYTIVYRDASSIDIHAYTRAFHPNQVLLFAEADYAMDKYDQKSQTGVRRADRTGEEKGRFGRDRTRNGSAGTVWQWRGNEQAMNKFKL